MRRLVLTSFVLSFALTGLFEMPSGHAMTAPVPAGLRVAIDRTDLAEEISFVCSLVRRCGPYGCEQRQCWETGYGYGPGYGPGYGFGYVYDYGPEHGFDFGPGYGPGFGYGPGPDYGGGYHVGRSFSTPNGCPPYWTTQDGGCRPYRGY